MVGLPFTAGSSHVLRDVGLGLLYLLNLLLLVLLLFLSQLIVNHLLLNLMLFLLDLISVHDVMGRILIPTLLLEHWVIFLVLVVDGDDF